VPMSSKGAGHTGASGSKTSANPEWDVKEDSPIFHGACI
jgi:hypothetical protein